MILADKIINERKKNGWSQEELAEQLSVSRQSVSKWEGAQALPDLQKIIAMAEIFGVTTDYLLKDDAEHEYTNLVNSVSVDKNAGDAPLRMVSFEEANDFMEKSRKAAPTIANGVSLCIISPALLIALSGLAEEASFGIKESVAAGIGVVALLAIVAVAVFMFITSGMTLKDYEFLEKENIDTAYGVTGMVNEKKKAMEGRRTTTIAVGVIMCILSPVPLLTTAIMEMKDYIVVLMVCVILFVVAVAVNMFVRVGVVWGSYEKLLQEGDYTTNNKESNEITGKIGGIYWPLVLAGYLAWSFTTNRWDISWIVWPIAGVIFGAIAVIIQNIKNSRL